MLLQKMRHRELMKPGCGDAADYIQERDMNYGTPKLMVLAVVNPETDMTAATPLLM
jgi:hypothetical protein